VGVGEGLSDAAAAVAAAAATNPAVRRGTATGGDTVVDDEDVGKVHQAPPLSPRPSDGVLLPSPSNKGHPPVADVGTAISVAAPRRGGAAIAAAPGARLAPDAHGGVSTRPGTSTSVGGPAATADSGTHMSRGSPGADAHGGSVRVSTPAGDSGQPSMAGVVAMVPPTGTAAVPHQPSDGAGRDERRSGERAAHWVACAGGVTAVAGIAATVGTGDTCRGWGRSSGDVPGCGGGGGKTAHDGGAGGRVAPREVKGARSRS